MFKKFKEEIEILKKQNYKLDSQFAELIDILRDNTKDKSLKKQFSILKNTRYY